MQGKRFNLPAALIALLCLLPSLALADASGPLSPFPITGAFSAEFREDRDHISIIEFSGSYDRTLAGGAANVEPRAVVAREFLRTHPDHYDFIVAFTSFEFETGEAAAFHFPIQNKVQGIGLPIFDVTSLFGSDGKLLGFTDMAALSRWVTDPMDPEFEKVLSVLSHEILHQWGVAVRFRDAGGNLSDALLGKDGAHWSYLLNSGASVEYGADWRDNGDGTFTSVGTRTFYSPLDLYLMGMYGPEEVPGFTLIDNPDIDKTKLPEQGVTISGTARTITIQDIIAAEGARIPGAADSQNEFRMAFVLLTTPGERVDERELLALNNIRKAFMTRFSVLTGGRAIAHVYPEALPVNEPGQPDTISGGELRQEPADLDAALAWLRSRQHPDGYWNDKPATRGRDTSAVFDVLVRYDAGFDGAANALAWLGQEQPASTDYLARTQTLKAGLGLDTTEARQRLAALGNGDGGWGIAPGYASDPLDTALVLGFLGGADIYAAQRDNAVAYLLQSQSEDGGWSGAVGGPSRTSVTAQVLLALNNAGRTDLPALDRALAWIAGKQNSDGGFGDSPSTAHDTALVLLALIKGGALERIRPDEAGRYLLGQQTVDGSWAGSTYATALAVDALKQFTFSNWSVESVAALPANPRDGERVTISAVLRNASGLGTPEGVLRIYAGDPDTGGTRVGTDIRVPPMAAGTALAFSRVWDSFDQPGGHTFFAVADPDDLVVETSERDNKGVVPVEVQAAPDAVDLELAGSDITIMPAHPNRLPSTLGINVNLRNLGLRDAAGVRVLLWDGEAGTGTLAGQTTLDVLGRSTVVANFNYVLERAGVTRLTVQLDPDDAIAEAREDNNVAWAEVVLDPSVDLAVGSGDITLDRASPLLGQDLVFSVKLHNFGTQPSPPATVRFLVTDGNITREIRADTVEIGPGETISRAVPWRADVAGALTFTAQLDGDALVAELDEGNNAAGIDFNVGTADGPNLVVGHQDFVFTPNPALELGAVTLDAVVRNAGTGAVTGISVAFYDGDPATGGRLLGTQTIPALEAGARQPVSFTWDAVPDSTDKVIFVIVDPDDTIVEFAEDDNQAFNVLPVLSLPDLAIADGDITVAPSHPTVGDTVTVTARLSNIGQQPASEVLVHAYDGDPDTGGRLIGERIVASLPPGEGASVEFSVTFSSERAEQPIVVQLDPIGAVPESNTENNVARRSIAVQDGSLYVSNRYFSPNGDGVKDDTRLVFRLDVAARIGVQVVNDLDRIIRTFAAESVAVSAGSVTWDGRDDGGRLAPDGDYRLRLVTGEGSTLGERVVTLDTNRSSLLKAIEDGQARETNLTCQLDVSHHYGVDIHFDENAEAGFFKTRDGHIARWLPAEQRAVDVVTDAWLKANKLSVENYGADMAPSPDGSRLFFVAYESYYNKRSLWAVEAEGGDPLLLGVLPGTPTTLVVSRDGATVFAARELHDSGVYIARFSVDTPGESTYVLNPEHLYPVLRVSPDGRWLAILAFDSSAGYWVVDLYDSRTGARAHRHTVFSGIVGYLPIPGLSWSPDGDKLAVTGSAGMQVFWADGRSAGFPLYYPSVNIHLPDPSWDSSGTEVFLGERNAVVDLGSGETSPVPGEAYDVGRYWGEAYEGWEPGQRALLRTTFGFSEAYYLEEQRYVLPFLERFMSGFARFTASGALLYEGHTYLSVAWEPLPSASNPECIEDFNNDGIPDYDIGERADVFLVESYSNLLARLDPARSADGGLSLRGTATDLHFSDYRLEYSTSESPVEWRPVGPASGREVIDGELAFWVPPGRSSYTVRLTVNDLAGNSRTATRRVVWSEPVSITNLYRSPDMFSPDGDGVKDEVRIHYRVLEPVHLEFTIENSAGDVVRNYVRDHSLAGSEYDILWDGRDDGGVLLPDGDYTLRVQNYRLRITIDITLPVATVSLRDAYQPEIPDPYGRPNERFVAVDPGISWDAQDAHLATLTLEKGQGGEPADWQPFNLAQLKNPRGESDIGLETFIGSRFRLTALDAAGNRVAVTTDPAREQLIITHFGQFALNEEMDPPGGWGDPVEACAEGAPVAAPDDWLEPVYRAPWTPFEADFPGELTAGVTDQAPFRIRLAETVVPALTQLVVEYREHGGAEWQQASVEEYVLGMDYCAFIAGQQEFLKIQPAAPEQSMDVRWGTKSLSPGTAYDLRIRGVDAAGNSHRSNTIQFHVTRTDLHLRGLVRDVDPASEDYQEKISPLLERLVPAWDRNAEELLWGEQRLEQPAGEVRLLLSSAEDARYATARVVDKLASPGEVFLFRVPDLRACTTYNAFLEAYGEAGTDGQAPLLARSLEPQPFRMPCIELEAAAEPVFAQACDAPPPGQVTVQLQPKALDGGALKLLTLSRWDADTGEDIVYNVNQPVSGRSYDYVLDTAALPEGRLVFTATLISAEDKVVTEPVAVDIDHTPPSVSFDYPVDGQRVCGEARQGADGTLRNVLTLEGTVDEAGSWHYQVEANEAVIHDSRRLDSLAASLGKNGAVNPSRPDLHLSGSLAGPLAALADGDGDVSARIRVFDAGGFQQCAATVFHFDGTVEIGEPSGDLKRISPNGDGESDSLTITHRVDEAVTVDVGIYAAERGGDGGYSPAGEILRSLESGAQLFPGETVNVWDGRDDGGALAADGDYVVVITYQDACGNRTERTLNTAVDGTPPRVELSHPQAGDALPMVVVEFFGTVEDAYLTAYEVQYGAGDAPATWSTVGGGARPVVDGILARWNTYGLAGVYTVRIAARDAAGNTTELLRTFTVPERTALLNQLEAVPALFSPNGDGRLEHATIRVGILEAVVLDMRVLSSDGDPVRILASDRAAGPGDLSLAWDGRDDQGEIVADGDYTVRVLVTWQSDGLVTQQETLALTVDRSAPLIQIARPSAGFATSAGGVIGSVIDPHLKTYAVQISSTPDAPAWTEIASGTGSRADDLLATLTELEEGEYALRILAEDEAENHAEQVLRFGIDNTAPEVGFLSPAADAQLSARSGPVAVQAEVREGNPAYYALGLGEGSEPPTWSELAHGNVFPLPDPVTRLDVSGLADGFHALRLTVEDKAGNQAERVLGFVVDNTPPKAEIQSPSEGEFVTGPTAITGSAADANLKEYRVYVAAGTKSAAANWTLLGEGTNGAENEVLLNWRTMPSNGTYTLRLVAADKAGNTSESLVEVSVSSEPPAPPRGLAASVENGNDVRLTWEPVAESGIYGYFVYRNDARATAVPVTNAEYLDAGLADGAYRYTVTAVGNGSVESAQSGFVEVDVDATPPSTALANIREGDILGGLVDVLGTAYAPSDFKEYRLYAGAGSSPANWELLRQSPLPVSGDLLGQWDTSGLPEGAVHTLKLEAEDLTGNIGVSRVSVTIDNHAPAAPTGLVALENGADVTLSWNASPEADVTGYLIFRDGEPVTGNAVEGTGYTDGTLPDGGYDYVVVAVDAAGNLSDPSLPAAVLIDTRAPHAEIVSPEDGVAFDRPLYVAARSADSDIASIAFQYRAQGSPEWITAATDTVQPYEFNFDPGALGLSHGDYQLQAIATDDSGKSDPAPVPIRVTYKDLTRPAAVTGLHASVRGGDVTLGWDANSEDDLAGYYVYAATDGGVFSRLNVAPAGQNSHVISGLADAAYVYYVSAVDISGNEGEPSVQVAAVVFTPAIIQPYTPTPQGATTLSGRALVPGTVAGEAATVAGTHALPGGVTDGEGNFALADIALTSGENVFTLRAEDAAGNISKPASVKVVRGEAPGAPTGLVATVNDYNVSLTWNANPEADLLGYRVFRDGAALHDSVELMGLSATASHNADAASQIFNGANYYWPTDGSDPAEGQWMSVYWPEPSLVTSLSLTWYEGYRATAFDVEAWSGEVWVPLAQIRDNGEDANLIELPAVYSTDRLRVLIREGQASTVRLRDIGLRILQTWPAPAYADSPGDGAYVYTVTAVNRLGFESEPSDPASAEVGDVIAPEPVELSGAVNGADVSLTWTPSSSSDVERYDIHRDGELVAQHVDLAALSFTDTVINGSYTYIVHAVDGAGNASAGSNPFVAAVNAELLPSPSDVVASPVAAGGSLLVSWTASGAASGYKVFRAAEPGGPYTQIYEGAEPFFTDAGLDNGASYYYVVVAIDSAGNASAYSTEAVGVPADTQPPAVPVIGYPTKAGIPYETSEATVTVAGVTEPGAFVSLARDAVDVAGGSALARSEPAGSARLYANSKPVASGDGRYVAYSDSSGVYVRDFVTGHAPRIATANDGKAMQWTREGLVFVSSSRLRLYRPADGSVSELIGESASSGSISPDRRHIVFYSSYYRAVYLYDRESGLKKQLGRTSSSFGDTLRWSPDSRYIAFRIYQGCYLVDTVTRNFTLLASSGGYDNPVWSADGRYLVYTEEVSGRNQLRRYWISEAREETFVGDPGHDLAQPVMSPQGDSMLYVVDKGDIWRRDIETGASAPFIQGYSDPTVLQWLDAGYLTFYSGGSSTRIALPGRFEIRNVPLQGGDNLFSARARDEEGNMSAPSEPILVRAANVNDARPDMVIEPEGISTFPAAALAGEPVRVNVTVRNAGGAQADGATLSLAVRGPDGTTVQLLDSHALEGLPPGSGQTVATDWIPVAPGNYSLVATADPGDLLAESEELNNVAVRAVLVTEEAGPRVTVVTDRTAYGANQDVRISAQVTGYGADTSGSVQLSVTDAGGYPVAALQTIPVNGLSAGQSLDVSGQWDTGLNFAGDYLAKARLLDESGAVLAENVSAFTVVRSARVEAEVTTDRAAYGASSEVRLTATIAYLSGNTLLRDIRAHVAVFAADGSTVVEVRRALGDLLPETDSRVILGWNTGLSAPGPYTAMVEAFEGDGRLALSESTFEILADTAKVSGSLQLSSRTPGPGEFLTATYQVTNGGNVDLTGLPITISLVDEDKQAIVHSTSATISVPRGTTVEAIAAIPTDALGLKGYTVLLQANVAVDGTADPRLLASAAFTISDRTPPAVELREPVDGAFLDAGDQAIVYAVDAHGQVAKVEISLDGGDWLPLQVRDAATGLYQRELPQLPDGAHVMRARATDAANNVALTGARSVIVDATAPQISLSGVAEGAYYNGPVSPEIQVSDANLSLSRVTVDDEPYTSGAITADGTHTVRVHAEDLAGNTTELEVSFTIDTVSPEFLITGVETGAAYAVDVVPMVELVETNPDAMTVTLNGSPFVPGTVVSEDGSYTLTVEARDLAGNVSAATVRFELDKTPPMLSVTTPADGLTIREPSIAVAGITEPLAVIELSANGYTASVTADSKGRFAFAGVPLDIGRNGIELFARDRAGNRSGVVTVYVNVLPPVELHGTIRPAQGVLVWAPDAQEPETGLLALLRDALAATSDYRVVDNESGFVTALRTQRYGTVVLLETQKDNSDCRIDGGKSEEKCENFRLSIGASTESELRLMVASGTGLLWIKTHPDANEHWEDLFGARFLGVMPQVAELVLTDEAAMPAGTYKVDGDALKAVAQGGQPIGSLLPGDGAPALVINRYGQGGTVLMTFDPSRIADGNGANAVLSGASAAAASAQDRLLAGGYAEVLWTVTEAEPPVEVMLDERLPDGMSFIYVPDGSVVDARRAVWTRLMTEAVSEPFGALITLPERAGTYIVTAALSQVRDGLFIKLVEEYLSFRVSSERNSLALDVVNRLSTWQPAGPDEKPYREALEHISAVVTANGTTREEAEACIAHLLEAEERLISMKERNIALEAALGLWLRSYQIHWSR